MCCQQLFNLESLTMLVNMTLITTFSSIRNINMTQKEPTYGKTGSINYSNMIIFPSLCFTLSDSTGRDDLSTPSSTHAIMSK